MNIYDSILTFSKDFKECEEVKEYKRLKKKIEDNPANKQILDDFHNKLYEYQIAKQNGEDVTEKEKQLNSLNEILMGNSEISAFLSSEIRISTIMNDIVKMIEDIIKN